MPRTIFRVFLSSTFGDFQAEREKLRAEVWPRLEALCAAHGASFHVVDLRWGISPSVATTHDTIQICLDEVIRCQQLSPRPKPNFLMLIGDRYGWRPPAVEISDADFRLIKKAVSSKDAAFLLSWYRKDSNAVPPVWCLKPRAGEYSGYEAWGPVESRITAILHVAAEKVGLSPEQYLYSATHMEIVNGLLQLEGAQDHIFSFNRELRGLPDSASKGIARRFADYLPEGTYDPEAKELLEVLKQQIAEVLPANQIHTYQADWLGHDDTPISTDHIDKFCSDVENSLLSVIKPELEEIAAVTPLQEELELQRQFLQETGSLLIGRDRELKRITSYLERKNTPLPLIIQATGGCGKSALMAKAVMAQEEVSTLIYRFIGAAPRSWQPQTFLEDLIQQIAEAYGQEPPPLPEEGGIKKVAELFHEQLALATEEQPLTIFIDAIDQFSATSPVQFADLFPRLIPPNVKLVISVLDGKEAEQLKNLYPKAPSIQLEPLTANACGKILDAMLHGRKLTKEQRRAILAKSKVSGLPLWLTLVAPIARKLNSWDTQPDLPGDIKELARYVIKRIADKHGHAITTASLRYIKLARFGLSETELQEILWADSDVRAEFEATRNPDQPEVDALPPVFWSRLYAELDPYINEYWMDGQLLHRYFHRVFGEVAQEMDEATKKSLHSRLTNYFEQLPMFYESNVVSQRDENNNADIQTNYRKVMELPHHLLKCNRLDRLKDVISDILFFNPLYCRDSQAFLKYWTVLKGKYEPGPCYLMSYDVFMNDSILNITEHICAATCRNLGMFLRNECSDLNGAEFFLRQSVAIRENSIGLEHELTVDSINSLAVLLFEKGEYSEAESLFSKCYSIVEKIFGADHFETAALLNNLSAIQYKCGDFEVAEMYCRRALKIRENTRGTEHLETAESIYNLAALMRNKGDLISSANLFRKAFEIRLRICGSYHPLTALSLTGLADVICDQGEYESAEKYYRQAIAIRENTLGKDHLATADSVECLANMLCNKGGYDDAEQLYRRSLMIYEKVLGHNHLVTATCNKNLAVVWHHKGNIENAIQNYRRALKTYKKYQKHDEIIEVQNCLGYLLMQDGVYKNLQESELLLLKAAHAGDAHAISNLGALYSMNGPLQNFDNAEKWFTIGANNGDAEDQRNLGKLLLGITERFDECKIWLNLAASSGDKEAIKLLQEIQH